MSVEILQAMARQGFEEVQAIHHAPSGLRAFLGIHDTTRGPAFGGIRRWAYRDEGDALRDVMRLARSMTHKCALAGLPAGGAKVVILDQAGLDLPAAYRHLGRTVEGLGGRFYTGPDVGTGPRELAELCRETRFATDPGPAGPGQLPEATSEGVFRGMESALRHLDGEEDWPRRTVVVQGLGSVGLRLARRLVGCGARVLASDIDPERAREAAEELSIEILDPTREYEESCDIFAPCALGGILHDLTIPRLRCRIVAGGANNILASPVHGERLHAMDVLYLPDFVINSGALIRGVLFHLEGVREPVEKIGERIGRTSGEILQLARERASLPLSVAGTEAERRAAATAQARG